MRGEHELSFAADDELVIVRRRCGGQRRQVTGDAREIETAACGLNLTLEHATCNDARIGGIEQDDRVSVHVLTNSAGNVPITHLPSSMM
jgi:hypothetical protein